MCVYGLGHKVSCLLIQPIMSTFFENAVLHRIKSGKNGLGTITK